MLPYPRLLLQEFSQPISILEILYILEMLAVVRDQFIFIYNAECRYKNIGVLYNNTLPLQIGMYIRRDNECLKGKILGTRRRAEGFKFLHLVPASRCQQAPFYLIVGNRVDHH
jgi:hypothetical protein